MKGQFVGPFAFGGMKLSQEGKELLIAVIKILFIYIYIYTCMYVFIFICILMTLLQKF